MRGKRIAALRQNLGLTQAELAKHINVSPSAIGMYEQGRREPEIAVWLALAEEFGVSLDYLVMGNMTSVQDVMVIASLVRKEHAKMCEGKNLKDNESLIAALLHIMNGI